MKMQVMPIDRGLLPLEERLAIQVELEALNSAGELDGMIANRVGVSGEAIRKARVRAEVGPFVARKFYAAYGLSPEELARRHAGIVKEIAGEQMRGPIEQTFKIERPLSPPDVGDRFRYVEKPVGSGALEQVLATFEWPDIDISIIDDVCKDARSEAFATGRDRPESAWKLRVIQLLRERTGRAKPVPVRTGSEPVDPDEESQEIRGARKKPKRL